MTIMVLFQIILALFGAVFVFGIGLLLFIFGRSTIKDRPNKGAVFVTNGNHIEKPFKADLKETAKNGQMFFYSDKKVVFYPSKYKDYYYCNRKAIFINKVGQLIASPFNQNIDLSDDEKQNLIYELCSSHIGADGMRALRGKSTMSVIIVAIIAFIIGLCVVIGFNAYQDSVSKQQVNQPKIEQQKPIIEVR